MLTREEGKPNTWPDGVEGSECPNDNCPSNDCPEQFILFGRPACSLNWDARLAHN